MSFAIIRTKKLKSFGAVVRSGRHTFREQLTPNADPTITPKNRVVGARSAFELKELLKQRMPEKVKRSAVLCIEYLVTASPEAFKRHGGKLSDMGDGYFADALKWLQQRHGKQNVLASAVHLDETTPHLVAYVLPMTADNRLSCRDYLGSPAKLRQMQTDFYEACGKARGLQRGVVGSKAKHQDIKSFYTSLSEIGAAPKIEAKDYAAAAIGIKTSTWRKAEAFTKAQAQAAAMLPTVRKSLKSRVRALDKKDHDLSDRLAVFEHKRVLLKQAERDLEQRAKALVERERRIVMDEHKVVALEAERDALERRLEILQGKEVLKQKAPGRGHNSQSEFTLG